MSEPYVLKRKVGKYALECLNGDLNEDGKSPSVYRLYLAMSHVIGKGITLDDLKDWIAALESDRGIVDPMTPEEELRDLYDEHFAKMVPYGGANQSNGIEYGIRTAVEIISKEHPDVADWLKEDDKDA
jgi:hypothetical protein